MSTPEKLITEHIDIWTSAILAKSTAGRGSNKKYELYGIEKLRELILELAVRGKLVPQDINDEPASILLERITAEKARLIKEGKIKKNKYLPVVSNDEKYFELPQGWARVRFFDIYPLEYGDNLPKAQRSNTGEYKVYGSNGIVGSHNKKCVSSPCIVVGRKGSAGALNMCLENGCWVTDVAYSCIPSTAVDIYFAFIHLQTLGLNSLGKGIKPGLNRNEAYSLITAIPPIAEQYRIVDKVDELMLLCDQLEQQTEASIDAHATLVEVLLTTLTDSNDASDLAQNWVRLSEYFDTLFTTDQSIEALKQTVLQLAVMGKLVPQNSENEPASVLLEKIATVKSNLIRKERLRTSAAQEISDGSKYLTQPNGWEWIRLGNLAKFIDYRGKTPKKIESGVRLITAKNIRNGYIDLQPNEFISEAEYDSWMTRGFPNQGDTLFTPEAPLGNAANVNIKEKFALAQRAICFQWHSSEISDFMLLQIMAKPFQLQLIDNATGMTATGIKASKLKEIPMLIPPIAEQHRIVAKVDELMKICDQLKDQLQKSQITQIQLTDALIEKALA